MAVSVLFALIKLVNKANTPIQDERSGGSDGRRGEQSVRKASRAVLLDDLELGQKNQKMGFPAVELELGGGGGAALDSPVKRFVWNIVHAVVIFTVLGLGIASSVLGILAEVHNSEVKVYVDSSGNCFYSDDTFVVLGNTAAALLSVAVVTVTVCACCGYGAKGSKCFPVRWLISSWIWALVAGRYFLLSYWARQQSEILQGSSPGYCSIVKPGAFVKGSALAFVAVISSINLYYFAAMRDCPAAATQAEKNGASSGMTGGTAQSPSHRYAEVPQSLD